jgi:hypothetical protein
MAAQGTAQGKSYYNTEVFAEAANIRLTMLGNTVKLTDVYNKLTNAALENMQFLNNILS